MPSDNGFTHSSQAGVKGGRGRVELTYQVFFPVSLPYTWSWRFKFKSKETTDQKQEVTALRIPRFCLGFCASTAEGLSSIPDQRNTILHGAKEKKKKGNWYLVPLVPLSLGHLGTLAASHPSHSTTGKGLRTRGCWRVPSVTTECFKTSFGADYGDLIQYQRQFNNYWRTY